MGNLFNKFRSQKKSQPEIDIIDEAKLKKQQFKLKFREQIIFKRYLNFLVSFIIFTQITTLIIDYFIGEFTIKNDSLSEQFVYITNNLGKRELYEIKVFGREDNCTNIGPDKFSYITFEKENLGYKGKYTLCTNTFYIDHTIVESNIYTNCKGYNVVGKRCPWHTPEVLPLIQQDAFLTAIYSTEGRNYTIQHRIDLKQGCVEELKNLWFSPMNEYSGTYLLYTGVIVVIIMIEVSAFIKYNKNYKSYTFEEIDNLNNSTQSLPWLERQSSSLTKNAKKYASSRKLIMENLQAIRILIVMVLIYSGFIFFIFYLLKVSAYNNDFKRIAYLVENQCFVKPIYNSYITQFYDDNFSRFCAVYYYRFSNNCFSGLCFLLTLYYGKRTFTWKELFCTSQSEIKKVFSQPDENEES
jgi:hypothetical protein